MIELARRMLYNAWKNRAPWLSDEPGENLFDPARKPENRFDVRLLADFLAKPDPEVAAELMALLGNAPVSQTGHEITLRVKGDDVVVTKVERV